MIPSLKSFSRALVVSLAVLALAGCARFEDKPLRPADVANRLENRSLADPALRAFLETNLHHAVAEWPLKQWDFDALTLAAFYYHPNLELARAQWASAGAGVKTAGGRPNPVLGVTPGYSANPPQGVSPWFPSVTLDIPLETAGKRGYRIAHAEHLTEAARLAVITTAWQVRSAIRSALLDYGIARVRVDVLGQQIQLQEQLLSVLQQRLAAGAVASIDLNPARLALLKLNADRIDAQRLASEARGRIAEAIGIPLRGIDGAEFTLDLDSAAPDVSLATLRRNALLGRADVLSALADYDASQTALQLEIAKQYPDVHLNPGYQYDQGEHKYSLGLSVELPVLNRNQGPIAEAKARRDEAAAKFQLVQSKVIAEIDRAQSALASAAEQMRQVNQLLDLHRQQFQQLEQAMKAGAADQLEVATARLEVATAEVARLDARVRQAQARALLEDAVQRPFAALQILEKNLNPQVAKENP